MWFANSWMHAHRFSYVVQPALFYPANVVFDICWVALVTHSVVTISAYSCSRSMMKVSVGKKVVIKHKMAPSYRKFRAKINNILLNSWGGKYIPNENETKLTNHLQFLYDFLYFFLFTAFFHSFLVNFSELTFFICKSHESWPILPLLGPEKLFCFAFHACRDHVHWIMCSWWKHFHHIHCFRAFNISASICIRRFVIAHSM